MTLNLNTKIYFIAEAGVNHNGSVKIAKSLILNAKKAGADAIKFQLFTPVIQNAQVWGNIFVTASTYTGYTVQGIDYYDYIDGTTVFFAKSSVFRIK